MGLPLFGTLPFRSDAVIDTVLNYCFPALGMSLELKPTHASVKAYYETLHQFGQLHIDHESAVRGAFQTLLTKCGQRTEPKLTLVPEYRIKRARGSSVILDGALVDLYKLPHGYWEAKDERDDLAREVECKLDKGIPPTTLSSRRPREPSSIRVARAFLMKTLPGRRRLSRSSISSSNTRHQRLRNG